MKLSRLLEVCIEKHLADTPELKCTTKSEFSCIAIDRCNEYNESYFKIQDFLCSLGLDERGGGFTYLREEDYYNSPCEKPEYDSQFTRALWLTFVIEYLKDNPEEDFEV